MNWTNRSKTTSTTTHVAKGSLAGTMSSTSSNTWDTCDSSAGTPTFSRSLLLNFKFHGLRTWWPAFSETAYGWGLFFATAVWTRFTKSGRMGALKTAGRGSVAPVGDVEPGEKTLTWGGGGKKSGNTILRK